MSYPSALLGRLDYNQFGVEGTKAIAAVLKDTQLVQLEYAIPRHPPPSPTHMSGPLNMHLACSQRSLRGNNLGDKGWTTFFKALCENKGDKIESWDLSNERVGLKTVEALAEYISVSPALKSVKCARHATQCVSPR